MTDLMHVINENFKCAHPAAQFGFLVFCLIAMLLFGFLFFRDHWRLRDLREHVNDCRSELKHCRTDRKEAEIRWEEDRERLREEIALARREAERDRGQLQRALPSFQRVIWQNEELLRLWKEADVNQRQTEAKAAQLQQLAKESDSKVVELRHVAQKNDELRQLREDERTKRLEIEQKVADLQKAATETDELRETVQAAETRAARLQAELDELRARFANLQKIDTNIWIAPSSSNGAVPAFVHRDKRRTRFVTFLNLKGGVGKTTLTANLAAAFATGVLEAKKSVLAIDLDYQGTLGNLCVEQHYLLDRRATHRTSERLLDDDASTDAAFLAELLVPMNGTEQGAMTIIADDQLDQVDFRKQALYVADGTEVRFHHRRLLHQPAIFERFDFVFFDCPPRLSTSTMNALAASDWIVVPTSLDLNDVEAVPRTLTWMEKLQNATSVDFHAQLGGVILNSTFRHGTLENLTKYETRSLGDLKRTMEKFVGGNRAILANVVKNENKLAQAAFGRIPFAVSNEGRDLYRDVARELYERIKG